MRLVLPMRKGDVPLATSLAPNERMKATTMTKLIAADTSMSLDGYITGPGRGSRRKAGSRSTGLLTGVVNVPG
jgi:hypothetical protein